MEEASNQPDEAINIPSLKIGGRSVPVGQVFVHLQKPWRLPPAPFVLFVPTSRLQGIFDPHHICPPEVPIDAFLTDLIAEHGTFVLEGYMEGVRKAVNSARGPFEWVIATVDRMESNDDGLLLSGEAIPWAPEAYEAKPRPSRLGFWRYLLNKFRISE